MSWVQVALRLFGKKPDDSIDEARLNADSVLKVDGSDYTQPVSGAVTTSPTGTQDVSLVSTTVTVPISAAALPLPSGAAADSTLTPVRNRFAPSTGDAVEATGTGDTLVYQPATGKRIRLKWLGFSASPSMPATTKVRAKFGAGGTPFYSWWMGAPGAFAHGVVREGAVDEALYVNCSVAPGVSTPVLVNIDVEEF